MQQKSLNYYLDQRFKIIAIELAAFAKGQDPECLHHVRVEIKKIRSILGFAEFVFKSKYSVNKMDTLFKKAGTIRKRNIDIQVLSKLKPQPEKLINKLVIKENVLRMKFTEACPKYIKMIETLNEKTVLPEQSPVDKAVLKYFDKAKTKSLKHVSIDTIESFHDFRKDVKSLIYINDALNSKTQKLVGLNIKYLHEVQKKAGEWHDTHCVIKYLDKKDLSKKMKGVIEKLTKIEIKQIAVLKKTVKSFKKDFVLP